MRIHSATAFPENCLHTDEPQPATRDGFHSRRPRFKCHLSANHRRQHWSQAHRRWILREWCYCLYEEARFVLHPSDGENVPGVGKVSPGMPRYYCNTVKPMKGVAGCLRWHLLRWEDRSGADTRDIDCHQLRRREPGSSRGAVRGCPGSPERSPVHFGRRQLYTPPFAAHHGLSEPMQHQHNATLVCQIAWYELQRDCLESSENENEPLHHSW